MVSAATTGSISGHSKVTLPHDEAIKAPFPPGCKVLCFDENGFRVGIVKDVLVFISLHEEATYGTYYEVELKGANLQAGKTSVFTAPDLRLTPDCPVQINPEYFGSVFRNDESDGHIEGIVLGSFEIPAAYDKNPDRTGKYFYSVRVKVPGMDEAVEAHGVPPDQITVLSSVSDYLDSASFSNASIILGGGSYDGTSGNELDHYNEKRNRTPQMKARRVSPEDMQAEDDFDQRSVRDGYYQNQFAEESHQDNYSRVKNNGSSQKSIHNIISNAKSHFYETDESESEQTTSPPKQRRSRSASRMSPKKEQSKTPSSRSISRTRTYVRSKTPVRTKSNRIPQYDDSSMTRRYADFKDEQENHSKRSLSRQKDRRDDYGHGNNYSNHFYNDASENSDSCDGLNDPNPPSYTEEEYESNIFQESNPVGFDDGREYMKNTQQGQTQVQNTTITPQERFQNVDNDSGEENLRPQSTTQSINSHSKNKAFGKTWTPNNQMKEGKPKESDEPNIEKLDSGARNFTPIRTRSTTPLPSRSSADGTPHSRTKLPQSTPIEGCYLIFDESSGGRFITQYSKTAVSTAIGFWGPGPGMKLQGFKFKQNSGRSDLMKGIAGKDYKKKYFSGWCQFIKAAKAYNGYFIKYSERERIEVDIYVFYNQTCEIEMVEDSKLFDVSTVSAVACVGKGNNTFNGVKTGELGTFLNKGASAGASLSM